MLQIGFDGSELQWYIQRLGKAASGKDCVNINKLAGLGSRILDEMMKQT